MQVGGQSGINLLLRYGPAQRCGHAADVHQQSLLIASTRSLAVMAMH
jgi:hypothetical protein